VADTSPPPKYRKPPTGPTTTELEERDRWGALSDQSLTSTQTAAEKWRTGLAAFITLITGGLLLKGPEAASDLTTPWRAILSALAAGGLLAAIAGLWLALRAAAGTPSRLNFSQVIAEYGGIRQFEIACATAASAALRWAKALVAASLLLLGAAVVTWWWAPPKPSQPPALVKVDMSGKTICGTLISADSQQFRVQVEGSSSPETIPFSGATNLRVVASC
jgi:hypothetical protein